MEHNIRELIHAEIDQISDSHLDELYAAIQQFVNIKSNPQSPLLTRLQHIKIQAPEDFAQNLDQYLSGEKSCP